MSLARRIKSWLTGAPRGPLVWSVPVMSMSPRRGSRQVEVAYRTNAWLRAVVDTVANGTATPRWRAYKPVGGGRADPRLKSALHSERRKALNELTKQRELVEVEHEIIRLLEHPSPEFTGRSLRKLSQIHLDLPGETFWWLQRDATGRVLGYRVLPPHAVTMTPTEGNPYFLVTYNLFTGAIPASEVLWFKELDPENPHGRGVGMGLSLADQLDAGNAIGRTLKATFERGGLPLMAVGVDKALADGDQLDDEEVEEMQKKYEAAFTGANNAGKVWFLPGKLSIAEVKASFRELQLQELDKGLRDYVRQVFNVSPELLGDLTSSNRSTSEEAKYTLAEYALLPRLEFWRTELMHKLVPLVDKDVILEYDDPRPQNWERTHKVMTTPVHEGFTWNEVREFAGFEPDPALEGKRPLPLPGAGAPAGEAKPAPPPVKPTAPSESA